MRELRADLRMWGAATIGLVAAIGVGTVGAIVTLSITLD